MIEIYRVLDSTGTVLDVLEPDRAACSRHVTGGALCGGCDSCLYAQAVHAGFRIERVMPLFGETESDVRGRTLSSVAPSPACTVKR